jgi:hypothetical protein
MGHQRHTAARRAVELPAVVEQQLHQVDPGLLAGALEGQHDVAAVELGAGGRSVDVAVEALRLEHDQLLG